MALALMLLLLIAGAMAYFRLAPSDVGRWHVMPSTLVPQSAGWKDFVLYPPGATDGVQPMPGGAFAASFYPDQTAAEVLSRLDAVALATPRTRRLAGSVETGMITWETRSLFWGFPDYTTAYAEPRLSSGATISAGNGTMLYVAARQRFGSDDFGVNALRLAGWLRSMGG